jgi:ElaB/YqjD/DUF883 family membrane-anchored ribosome-binding protein
MTMEAKKYLYAAVGAPIATLKQTQERAEKVRSEMSAKRKELVGDLQKQFDAWATEGEDLVSKIGDSKAIDEINEFVDFDQMQEQVSKLRDQLEDLLETWRANFRPASEKATKIAEKVEVEVKETAAAKTTTAKRTTTAKKPAAKKTTTATKKAPAKKPAAKKTTTAKAS